MNPMRLVDLAAILGGDPRGVEEDLQATGFALDSREARPGDLFLAIKGARVDGHDFVSAALERGAVASLAEREVEGPHVLVPNLVDALARMALHIRETFNGPVVGITGSVGKTTTKEFLARALSPLGKIAQTAGNRNTEFTAPLLWAELGGDERAVIVEMAMRGFGQIAHLASFSRPTVGLITNIGHSHLETVGTREGIAQAKAELFEALPRDGLAIAPAADDFLGLLRAQALCPVVTFGFRSGEARVTRYEAESWTRSRAVIDVRGRTVEVALPAAGRHLALNAASALLAAYHFGVNLEAAAAAMAEAKLPANRMEILERGGVTIVLDAYNAAPASFAAALETLSELPCERERLVVMGEMKELGALSEEAHREVGRAMARARVDRACFFGEGAMAAMAEFEGRRESGDSRTSVESGDSRSTWAESIEDVRRFVESAVEGDTVLIKGSRAMELERAVASSEAVA